MHRQLVIDVHERINEIPAVPGCYLVNQQPRERSWMSSVGKEDPVEFDSSLICAMIWKGRLYRWSSYDSVVFITITG